MKKKKLFDLLNVLIIGLVILYIVLAIVFWQTDERSFDFLSMVVSSLIIFDNICRLIERNKEKALQEYCRAFLFYKN